jgi:hypothetical protein
VRRCALGFAPPCFLIGLRPPTTENSQLPLKCGGSLELVAIRFETFPVPRTAGVRQHIQSLFVQFGRLRFLRRL